MWGKQEAERGPYWLWGLTVLPALPSQCLCLFLLSLLLSLPLSFRLSLSVSVPLHLARSLCPCFSLCLSSFLTLPLRALLWAFLVSVSLCFSVCFFLVLFLCSLLLFSLFSGGPSGFIEPQGQARVGRKPELCSQMSMGSPRLPSQVPRSGDGSWRAQELSEG